MATGCGKKLQGIPLTGTPFTIENLNKKMFICSTTGKRNPFLQDDHTNGMELFFVLVPAAGRDIPSNSSYIIKSLNTNLALTDNSSGEGYSVEVEPVNTSNKNQCWSIQASTKYSRGNYKIVNLGTHSFLNALADSNQLQTVAEGSEDGYQDWNFIFTEGLGIPLTNSEIRIKNHQTSRILFAGDKVFVQDKVTNLREQIFALFPSTVLPGAYLIQSLNKGLYLEDGSDGSGKSDAVKTTELDQSSECGKKLVWSLLPGIKYPGTYRIQNYSTRGCLLNGPPGHNELQTVKDKLELPDQCWTFLDASM